MAPSLSPADSAAEVSAFSSTWLRIARLAHTGMRRGELLALRWRHIDLEAGTVSVRRSVGVVRVKGEGAIVKEGDTKTAKPHVVDIDAATVALLKAYKRERGGMALQLARDDALVFGDQEGNHRHPERFSRGFQDQLGRCARAFEKADREALPRIRVLSRPGARCRDCSQSVSPGRSPNPPCRSLGNGLSTVSIVRRGS
ncbi:hypothetical protein ETD85_41860, partial [Nonomuraea zeae]